MTAGLTEESSSCQHRGAFRQFFWFATWNSDDAAEATALVAMHHCRVCGALLSRCAEPGLVGASRQLADQWRNVNDRRLRVTGGLVEKTDRGWRGESLDLDELGALLKKAGAESGDEEEDL